MSRRPAVKPLSPPFNYRLGFGVPLVAIVLLLATDPTRIDFALARLMYEPEAGFIGRNSWVLENLLHDRAKQVVIAFVVCALGGLLLSLVTPSLHRWRHSLAYLVIAMALATGMVSTLKKLTQIHCPWSLVEFGGSEQYTPLLAPRPATTKPGRCWPGGHATTGFSLFALFFALRDHRPRLARIALMMALGLGGIFSLGRMLQGAHFLSHNVWTALLDWLICLSLYWLLLRRANTSISHSGK